MDKRTTKSHNLRRQRSIQTKLVRSCSAVVAVAVATGCCRCCFAAVTAVAATTAADAETTVNTTAAVAPAATAAATAPDISTAGAQLQLLFTAAAAVQHKNTVHALNAR